MGILGGLLERRGTTTTLANPADWFVSLLGGGTTAFSGATVSGDTALGCNAVYSCVRVLAETIASLPLFVYRRLDSGGKNRAIQHWLYDILHDRPNPEMTRFEYLECQAGHVMLWGNAYSEIEWNGAGKVAGIWPLRPDRMNIKREASGLVYEYTLATGGVVRLDPVQVLHVRGLSGEGILGYSPIRLAREAIGLGLAAEEYGSRFFANNANPSGVLQMQGKLSDAAYQRLKKEWAARHQGLSNSQRVAILEEGLTWQQIGIPPEDAQFLETRKFQLEEIARMYRVPLMLLQAGDKAPTYASAEQFMLAFTVHTLRPWLVRFEQRFNTSLLWNDPVYFCEFLVDGLLRGDLQSRYTAYSTGRQWGWLCADDVREIENMNPLPDGQGKMYLVPMNMVPASQAGKQPPTKESQRAALMPIVEATLDRIARREQADILRAREKYLDRGDSAGWQKWCDGFLADHARYVGAQITPLVCSVMAGGNSTDSSGMSLGGVQYIEERVESIRTALQGMGPNQEWKRQVTTDRLLDVLISLSQAEGTS